MIEDEKAEYSIEWGKPIRREIVAKLNTDYTYCGEVTWDSLLDEENKLTPNDCLNIKFGDHNE